MLVNGDLQIVVLILETWAHLACPVTFVVLKVHIWLKLLMYFLPKLPESQLLAL